MQTQGDLKWRRLACSWVWVQEITSAEKDNLKHETEPGELIGPGLCGGEGWDTRRLLCGS